MNNEKIKLLIKNLEDENWLVRYNAARIMGDIDAEEAIEDLLKAIKTDPNRDVRHIIAQALGKIDLQESIPTLIDVMKNDTSMIVRYTAARALARMGALSTLEEMKNQANKEINNESIFWFNVSIARLENNEKCDAVKKLKDMKKEGKLNEKQSIFLDKFLKSLFTYR